MRFIFKLVVFIFLFQNYTAFCQNHKILYRILNDTIIVDPRDEYLEVSFEIGNLTDTDFILHSFSDIRPGIMLNTDDAFCFNLYCLLNGWYECAWSRFFNRTFC